MRAESVLVFAGLGCASGAARLDDPPASVRDRLEAGDARLIVSAIDSVGSVTARHRIPGGWSTGHVELHVERGELVAAADGHGQVTIDRLGLWLAPIDIPPSVLGHRAQLTKVHVAAGRPIAIPTVWTSDDDARATSVLELELSWSLAVNGNTSPLGAPDLPPVPVALVVTGDGVDVHAELRTHAPGVVWSWADLVRLEDLELVLDTATM